ncbi:MAG: tagatose-6-phosphate ketose isomerase [Bryobacteraceae bacterium]
MPEVTTTAPCAVDGATLHVNDLLSESREEQERGGYFHTLREILQQPSTWLDTAERMTARAAELSPWVEGIRSLVLTGSGSSEYAGACVRLVLQNALSVATQTLGGGVLLTHGARAIPPERPGLMISLARSGDSPESVAAVSLMLDVEPGIRHLVITCNRQGRLAITYRDDPRVQVIALDERTNDRSLVMTSSFTNMVLAARALGLLQAPDRYRALCRDLSERAGRLLGTSFPVLARVAEKDFNRVLFLGSGSRFGAARESALKMLEMTAGRVIAISETYLGLRHGPMSLVHSDTWVVCFLSSDPQIRGYESDLIRELSRKQLGLGKLIFGEHIPHDLAGPADVLVESTGSASLGDEDWPVLDVIVGQILAFFRCRKEGLQPDSPSSDGVIQRVVQNFALHRTETAP